MIVLDLDLDLDLNLDMSRIIPNSFRTKRGNRRKENKKIRKKKK